MRAPVNLSAGVTQKLQERRFRGPCVGLLKPKVKRKHWFQNADAFTHAHGIQVIGPGLNRIQGSWGPVSYEARGAVCVCVCGNVTGKAVDVTGRDLEHNQPQCDASHNLILAI